MKYRALILDLDGTVIPSGLDSVPSLAVTDAIAKAKNKIHICIATGRPLFLAKPIIDHLELSGPCVLNNGTQIYDPQGNEILKEYPLKRSSLPKILDVFRRHKKDIRVFDGKKDLNLNPRAYPDIVFSVYLSSVTAKVADKITDELGLISGITVHKMESWEKKGDHSLEVTSDQATKLHGIVEVTKILNVKKEEVIGVGDSYNDFPLLMASGLKIAMGNAISDLKAIADFIAPPVEEDGVATVIEKFVLS